MPSQNYTEEDVQNGIPANAKVKSIEDSNVSYQTTPISKTQELINKYFNTKEEAPVLDQAKVERLQRMGRINTLGRGLNVLGDGLSLALGANVKRKAPDTTAPALYQSYENTLDQHTQEVKGYKQRDFQKKLSDIQFGISRLDKETDQDYRERVQKANNEFKKVKNAQDLAKWQLDYDINKGKATESERHNKEMEKAALIRANKIGTKASDKEGEKPFMVAGLNGQDIPLSQGEFRDLLAEATQAANKAGTNSPQFKDFQATMESFKDNPLEGQKNIVQRYYSWKKEQESLTKNRELKGSATQPVQQAPKAKFNPDKAKKFKGSVPQGGF